MRCSKCLLVALVACGSGVAMAGPLDRNAASKATGDMIGQAPERSSRAFSYSPAPVMQSSRAFSYSPAPAAAAPQAVQAVPAPPVQVAPAPAMQAQAAPSAPVRRYSYQAAPRYYRAPQQAQPGYLRVDKKILGY
jgi:hypothetical protein